MLSPYVQAHIRSLNDKELLDYITTGAEHHEPDAIEFARTEALLRCLVNEPLKPAADRGDPQIESAEPASKECDPLADRFGMQDAAIGLASLFVGQGKNKSTPQMRRRARKFFHITLGLSSLLCFPVIIAIPLMFCGQRDHFDRWIQQNKVGYVTLVVLLFGGMFMIAGISYLRISRGWTTLRATGGFVRALAGFVMFFVLHALFTGAVAWLLFH